MLKFLRKYNAIILVFSGVLLMITFLIPQALQQLGQGAGAQVLGNIDGKTLSGKDYLRAKRELEIVNTVMPEFVRQWDVNVEHWLLLTIEADREDLMGGQLDGHNFFARMIDETMLQFTRGQNLPDEQFAELQEQLTAQMNGTIDALRRRGYPENEIFATIGKLAGVWRLINLHQVALPLSTPEAWEIGMDLFDTATADIGAIPADDLAPDPASLSEGSIESHFEQYRAQHPSENDFGIGYRLPDAVGLEMLRIDRSALSDAIEVDPIELRLHFDDLQANNILVGRTFEESRDQVRASYINERSAQLMEELVLAVRRELLKSRVGLNPSAGFYPLPDNWAERRPTLEALADAVRAKAPSTDPDEPIVHIRPDDGGLLDAAALAALEGTRGASYRVNERLSIPFAQYVLGVRELDLGQRPFALQEGFLPAEPMRINGGVDDGDALWVRITAVRREGPATNWRTIEEQVRKDLASIEGYNALAARQDELTAAVAATGVAVLLDMDFPNATYNIDGKVTRQAVRLADNVTLFQDANVQSFRDALMDLVKPWDPLLDVATLPLEDRTTSALDPATRKLIIGQVTGRMPMTLEQFSRNALAIQSQALRRRSVERDPISFEAVAERLNYVSADADDAQETPDDAPAQDNASDNTQ